MPVFYDPLLAKLIAVGETRETAIRRAVAALKRFAILGVRTNIAFLIQILEHPRFASGGVDTAFIDSELTTLTATSAEVPAAVLAVAARVHAAPVTPKATTADPWTRLQGWRCT